MKSLVIIENFRLSFAKTLSTVENALRADQIDGAIDAQGRICHCLGIEHSALWQGSPREPGLYLLTHLYRDPGLRPVPDRLDGNTYFPWSQRKLVNQEILNVRDVLEVIAESLPCFGANCP